MASSDETAVLIIKTDHFTVVMRHFSIGDWSHYGNVLYMSWAGTAHDDVIKWKHFPRYWPFVQGIRRSPVISPHKGQWRGGFMFPLTCDWINGWVSNHDAGDLRRHRAHYDVTVMWSDVGFASPFDSLASNGCFRIWYIIHIESIKTTSIGRC